MTRRGSRRRVAEYQERLRRQRRQIARKEASRYGPFPVTVTKVDGSAEQLEGNSIWRSKYERYINSKKWEARKVAYYRCNPKRCWRCGSTVRIHLHHHTYERLGHELDKDLVPLCEPCHARVHELHRTELRHSLTEATIAAIDEHPRGTGPSGKAGPRPTLNHGRFSSDDSY